MKAPGFLKRLFTSRDVDKTRPRLSFVGVSHHIGNEELGRFITGNAKEHDVLLVEGSIYLGSFLPTGQSTDKIRVLLEPPRIFLPKVGGSDLTRLYIGGRDIPDFALGARRMFEMIAADMEGGLDRRSMLRSVHDLLYLRQKSPDLVVYNEPKAWLRTVWYESDLLAYYAFSQRDHPLFGAFIYSDMDQAFGEFLERNGNAVSAMTGDNALLFAFDGRADRESDLYTASEYVSYRAVLETPRRFEEPLSPSEVDRLREREARMLTQVAGVNRSLLFGRRLGVRAADTPCLILWRSLDEHRVLTVPFGTYQDDAERVTAMKRLADLIADAVVEADGDVLATLQQRLSGLPEGSLLDTSDSIGSILRSFLEENAPPLRERLTIDDVDSFERVRSLSPADVSRLLGPGGYLDLAEDAVQRGLERIFDVPFHKKDWGGETNDLYTANLVVNGMRLPTAFLLKGNGLKRPNMRIADCGKNGDQLLRLFDSPASLFVIQFVGQVSEAVIADVQGKVALRRSQGKPSWYLVMDGQDTARLLRAYGLLGALSDSSVSARLRPSNIDGSAGSVE